MTRRLPSAPPNLPGFSYVRALGSGGFADVFLFEQNMPRRQVAVKVLLAEVVNDQVRQLFQAEANLMAQLSSHPAILTVFQASVSADGRPYLVMEYCSSTLSQQYRTEPLAVPDVLRIGIRIASAVETAHRGGVLHRDIKPSNILVTAYGHPVLSDFGIAATLSEADNAEAVGLSIPWSAPEVLLEEVSGSVAAEVWSIAATLYSLLAGRSPFEEAGSQNTSAELMSRIVKARVPPIGRADVPARLELILTRAMSRRPDARPRSVLELIRELQSVEAELDLPQTQLEVAMADWANHTPADADDKTRITGMNSIDPHVQRRRRKPAQAAGGAGSSRGRSMLGGSAPGSNSLTRTRTKPRRTAATRSLLAAAVLVVVIAATAVFLFVRASAGPIPAVNNIEGVASGDTVVFTWPDPGVAADDSYVVTLPDGASSIQRAREFSIDAADVSRVCITVAVNRAGKTGAPSGEKCVETPEAGSQ
ncbi:serine/threonine-protein kinase [Glaciibacter superstes]|uniref:serine/threonine-protein kinase n=1 Tax=Glaciibacter superstes TaxID=501023 RepID=UPI0003B377AF|nr:serine/threonine-protein kinase [Glaciibacter superstes]